MGKRETEQLNKDLIAQQKASRDQYEKQNVANKAAIDASKVQADASRDSLNAGIGGIGNTAGQWGDFISTGGYSPGREASIMENVSGLKEFGRTGGLDADSINRYRGMGGFEEFARTGGVSDRDRSNIRSRALAPVSSAATEAENELTRRRALQGGYAPGFDAASRSIKRDTTRGISDVTRDAELGIMDRVNEGRKFGIGGMSTAEGNLQSLRTGNMFRGMTSAADIEMNLQNSINNYKAMGMSAQDAAARAMADLQAGMFSTDNANEQAARDREIRLLEGKTGADLGYFNARTPPATKGGIGGSIVSGLGSAAGLFGKLFSGGTSGGSPGSALPGGSPATSAETSKPDTTPQASNFPNHPGLTYGGMGSGELYNTDTGMGYYPGMGEPSLEELMRRQRYWA